MIKCDIMKRKQDSNKMSNSVAELKYQGEKQKKILKAETLE